MMKKKDTSGKRALTLARDARGARSIVVTHTAPPAGNRVVSFGEVTISGPAPDKATVERNITASNAALESAVSALAKPGVKLPKKVGVPLYWASPDDPPVMIRELNGRRERGAFIGGKFQTIE